MTFGNGPAKGKKKAKVKNAPLMVYNCAGCGNPIEERAGMAVYSDGEKYHAECQRLNPRKPLPWLKSR